MKFTPMNNNKRPFTVILNLIQNLVDEIKQNEAIAKFDKSLNNNKKFSTWNKKTLNRVQSDSETPTSLLALAEQTNYSESCKTACRMTERCHAVTGEGKSMRPSLEFLSSLPFANKFFSPRGEMSSLPPLGEDVRRTGEGKSYVIAKESKKKAAFTLAEVLITLGIIGVVAAMTLPTLMTNLRNKHLRVELKKTYSELNQVSMRFLDEYEMPVPEYVISNGYTELDKEMAKVIKGWHNTSKTWKAYSYSSLNTRKATSSLCDVSTVREDLLGKLFTFDNLPVKGYNGPRICVDINGTQKPNVLGVDFFTFIFTQDGHVIPEGQDHESNNYTSPYYAGGTYKAASLYCNGDIAQYSLACTYYAMQNKNPKGNGTYWEDFIGRKLYK